MNNNISPYMFKLELKSRSRKTRMREAIEKLKLLYPYKVKEENLLINETHEKNIYSVIINEKGFKNKNKKIRPFVVIALVFVFFFVSGIIIFNRNKLQQIDMEQEKLIELQNEQKIMEIQSKKDKLAGMLQEISKFDKEKYENLYERIELLYSLLNKAGTIENLSIEKDSFTIDITSKDSVKLLENFEMARELSKVKMSRTSVDNGVDYLSLSGEFTQKIYVNDESQSLEEQINRCDEILSGYKSRKLQQGEQNLSDYIKRIRECIHNNDCNEQYLQVKGGENNLEVELMLYSYAEDVLSFIKEIQNENNEIIDIKKLRIRNSDNASRIQTNITFATGIDVKENAQLLAGEKKNYNYSPVEISESLYKEPKAKIAENPDVNLTVMNQSPQSKTVEEKKIEVVSENKVESIKRCLDYIGLTKLGDKSYILAKDLQMDVIYKFEVSEKNCEGNICYINENGKYIAKLNSELYEVKK